MLKTAVPLNYLSVFKVSVTSVNMMFLLHCHPLALTASYSSGRTGQTGQTVGRPGIVGWSGNPDKNMSKWFLYRKKKQYSNKITIG